MIKNPKTPTNKISRNIVNKKQSHRPIEEIVRNIDLWRLPTKKSMQSFLNKLKSDNKKKKRKNTKKAGYLWSVSEKINPLQVYLYLKVRFGKPNGLQMLFKNKTSDNLIHWEWMVSYKNHMMHFTGFNFHFNIMISESQDGIETDKDLFIRMLKKDFGKYRKQMDDEFKKLEQWFLFINPYYHYTDLVQDLFTKLKRTKLANPTKASRPSSTKEMLELNKLTKNLHKAFTTGMLLKLLIPIWIESFVNLILVLYMKEELKRDKKVFEDKKRQSIFKKIKSLHLDCYGFTEEIYDSELIEIKKIFKSRNRYLHGSFEPKFNPATTVYFDSRTILLFNSFTYAPSLIKNLLLNEVNEVTLDKEITAGEEFILRVFHKIDSQLNNHLKRLTHENFPGWDEKRHILGAVLPGMFVDLFHVNDGPMPDLPPLSSNYPIKKKAK